MINLYLKNCDESMQESVHFFLETFNLCLRGSTSYLFAKEEKYYFCEGGAKLQSGAPAWPWQMQAVSEAIASRECRQESSKQEQADACARQQEKSMVCVRDSLHCTSINLLVESMEITAKIQSICRIVRLGQSSAEAEAEAEKAGRERERERESNVSLFKRGGYLCIFY